MRSGRLKQWCRPFWASTVFSMALLAACSGEDTLSVNQSPLDVAEATPTGIVRGVVFDQLTNEPIPGATVVIYADGVSTTVTGGDIAADPPANGGSSSGGSSGGTTPTTAPAGFLPQVDVGANDDPGSFAFTEVPASEFLLVIRADGYAEARIQGTLDDVIGDSGVPQGNAVKVQDVGLVPADASVMGEVVLKGNGPAEGATVHLRQTGSFVSSSSQSIFRTVETNAAGQFAFDEVPDGNYQVIAEPFDLNGDGWPEFNANTLSINTLNSGSNPHELLLVLEIGPGRVGFTNICNAFDVGGPSGSYYTELNNCDGDPDYLASLAPDDNISLYFTRPIKKDTFRARLFDIQGGEIDLSVSYNMDDDTTAKEVVLDPAVALPQSWTSDDQYMLRLEGAEFVDGMFLQDGGTADPFDPNEYIEVYFIVGGLPELPASAEDLQVFVDDMAGEVAYGVDYDRIFLFDEYGNIINEYNQNTGIDFAFMHPGDESVEGYRFFGQADDGVYQSDWFQEGVFFTDFIPNVNSNVLAEEVFRFDFDVFNVGLNPEDVWSRGQSLDVVVVPEDVHGTRLNPNNPNVDETARLTLADTLVPRIVDHNSFSVNNGSTNDDGGLNVDGLATFQLEFLFTEPLDPEATTGAELAAALQPASMNPYVTYTAPASGPLAPFYAPKDANVQEQIFYPEVTLNFDGVMSDAATDVPVTVDRVTQGVLGAAATDTTDPIGVNSFWMTTTAALIGTPGALEVGDPVILANAAATAAVETVITGRVQQQDGLWRFAVDSEMAAGDTVNANNGPFVIQTAAVSDPRRFDSDVDFLQANDTVDIGGTGAFDYAEGMVVTLWDTENPGQSIVSAVVQDEINTDQLVLDVDLVAAGVDASWQVHPANFVDVTGGDKFWLPRADAEKLYLGQQVILATDSATSPVEATIVGMHTLSDPVTVFVDTEYFTNGDGSNYLISTGYVRDARKIQAEVAQAAAGTTIITVNAVGALKQYLDVAVYDPADPGATVQFERIDAINGSDVTLSGEVSVNEGYLVVPDAVFDAANNYDFVDARSANEMNTVEDAVLLPGDMLRLVFPDPFPADGFENERLGDLVMLDFDDSIATRHDRVFGYIAEIDSQRNALYVDFSAVTAQQLADAGFPNGEALIAAGETIVSTFGDTITLNNLTTLADTSGNTGIDPRLNSVSLEDAGTHEVFGR